MPLFKDLVAVGLVLRNDLLLEPHRPRLLLIENLLNLRVIHVDVGEIHVVYLLLFIYFVTNFALNGILSLKNLCLNELTSTYKRTIT